MRAVFLFLGAAGLLFSLSGCETELPPHEPSVGAKLQRGIRGEGSLYIPGRESSSVSNTPSGR
ncbi:MAG: hypothetical protein RLZZ399_1201 [Verrucomicrobiota bacterium]|jgi:hypothetical protein